MSRRIAVLDRELPAKRGDRLISREEAMSICEFDAQAIEITGRSTYTTHHRHRPHRAIRAANIINDFFELEHFRGRRILEFGPGHYSFALLARHLGATVVCIERDPIFVELGEHLGFPILSHDFFSLTPEDIGDTFDGVWMKGTFNAASLPNDEAVDAFVDVQTSLLTLDAWGWCVTVNKRAARIGKEPGVATFVAKRIERQRAAYERHGWHATPIEELDRKRYALSYAGSHYYFTRNLAAQPVG